MRFAEGNTIVYGQGYRFFVGLPHDIDFTVTVDHHHLVLTAPGYGGDPCGSGTIHVGLPLSDECQHWPSPSPAAELVATDILQQVEDALALLYDAKSVLDHATGNGVPTMRAVFGEAGNHLYTLKQSVLKLCRMAKLPQEAPHV